MPKISVIMPVYNTKEAHLRCAIESILNQTFGNFEFLIVDDGSQNNVQEVIDSYNDARITLFDNKKNKGLIYSLNRALDEANGEYIARMDSDDESLPERFEMQVKYLDEHPEISLIGSSIQYFDNSTRVFEAPEGSDEIKFLMLKENVIAHPTVMFRKSDFNDLRYDEKFKHAEDYELWVRALLRGLKFENLPKVLLNYRIHKGQVGSNYNKKQRENAAKAKRELLKAFDSTLNEREIDVLISLTDEHISFNAVYAKEYETLLKKMIKTNVQNKFFDSRKLISWIGYVSKELKYPKKRLFSLKMGKKYTLYVAHNKATFKDETVIFNSGLALTCAE